MALPPEPPETESAEQERRQSHRIRYPLAERPSLLLGKKESLPVLDISERGLRCAVMDNSAYKPGDFIKGEVRFRRGVSINIEGTVVRAHHQQIALYLHREIPFNILLAEQRRLHAHYPMWS